LLAFDVSALAASLVSVFLAASASAVALASSYSNKNLDAVNLV